MVRFGWLPRCYAAWKQKRRASLTLEERRMEGVRMIVEQGLSEHDVARRLGVTQGIVSAGTLRTGMEATPTMP